MSATHYRDIDFVAGDGLRLHARDYAPQAPADESGLPVICLPGLSRNVRDFHDFALLISSDAQKPRRVVSLDYRGRGLSHDDPDPANYNLGVESQDVIALCDWLGIGRALFVGTSRGGLILHLLVVQRPDLIAGAVLNDIGPEIEAAGLMDIRDYLTKRTSPPSFPAAAALLKEIHGATFPALGEEDWLDMAHAIYRERDGHIEADHDPALTEQLRQIDFSQPLPTLWPQFALLAQRPLLAIRGEHSRLLSQATLERMAGHGARPLTAPGQGHAPLLHLPTVYSQIADFLRSVDL